ncbi:hypothetical protein SERLA73DRAFT_128434 [Serpula lacrymans var. lacrymans S7.3]|uniref:Transposase Helix-turn-helix domain-containing protein n=1 Tax=Serpula lacrymans var. lacrymans (strain S7.3) TaxID=936435 RepID=F8PG77_SERL3|nr:hypothetical protein SERLA73DRAFT_128434 [Serpula lacrymans var. lacrymans S7.3]
MDIRVGQAGHINPKYVTLQEKLGVFLYMCITELTLKHVGEHFQCANDTLSK